MHTKNFISKNIWVIAFLGLSIGLTQSLFAQKKNDKKIEKVQPETKNVVEILFDKTTTDFELQRISDSFLAEHNMEVTFTNVKRNENDEITSISIQYGDADGSSKSSYMFSSNTGISPMKIVKDKNSNAMSITNQGKSLNNPFENEDMFGNAFKNDMFQFNFSQDDIFKNLKEINPELFESFKFNLDSLPNGKSFSFDDENFKTLKDQLGKNLDGETILSLEDFMKKKLNGLEPQNNDATRKELDELKKELEKTKKEVKKLKSELKKA